VGFNYSLWFTGPDRVREFAGHIIAAQLPHIELVEEYIFSTVPDAELFLTATPALASKTLTQYTLVKPRAWNWSLPDDVDPRVESVRLPSNKSFIFHDWRARTKEPLLW
jgi:hypothetical protein